MKITLSDDVQKRAVASIRNYFDEALDQEIGDLKAAMLLEFFLVEIAPTVYNAAISDAQTYLRDRVADLDGAYSAPEFAYWQKPQRGASS